MNKPVKVGAYKTGSKPKLKKAINKTPERLLEKQQKKSKHYKWKIYRRGDKDGITVLYGNMTWGRLRSSACLQEFLIFKDGKEVDSAIYYSDVREIIKNITK